MCLCDPCCLKLIAVAGHCYCCFEFLSLLKPNDKHYFISMIWGGGNPQIFGSTVLISFERGIEQIGNMDSLNLGSFLNLAMNTCRRVS